MGAVLAAVSALAVAREGFTVSELSTEVQAKTGQGATDYSIAKLPTTCANCGPRSSSSSPVAPGATRSLLRPPGPSPPSASCVIRWSAPSSLGCVVHAKAVSPPPGPASTATTRLYASICKPSSRTSASLQGLFRSRHRQHFVDQRSQAASARLVPEPPRQSRSRWLGDAALSRKTAPHRGGYPYAGCGLILLVAGLDARILGLHGSPLRDLTLDPSVDHQHMSRAPARTNARVDFWALPWADTAGALHGEWVSPPAQRHSGRMRPIRVLPSVQLDLRGAREQGVWSSQRTSA